jgi:hypothetical protein
LTRRQRDSGNERTRQQRQRQATPTSDSDGGHGIVTADTAATSRHVDDIDSDKTTMNTPTVTDGLTVADTMTTGTVTAGMTTSGSSGINVAPRTAIPSALFRIISHSSKLAMKITWLQLPIQQIGMMESQSPRFHS